MTTKLYTGCNIPIVLFNFNTCHSFLLGSMPKFKIEIVPSNKIGQFLLDV